MKIQKHGFVLPHLEDLPFIFHLQLSFQDIDDRIEIKMFAPDTVDPVAFISPAPGRIKHVPDSGLQRAVETSAAFSDNSLFVVDPDSFSRFLIHTVSLLIGCLCFDDVILAKQKEQKKTCLCLEMFSFCSLF